MEEVQQQDISQLPPQQPVQNKNSYLVIGAVMGTSILILGVMIYLLLSKNKPVENGNMVKTSQDIITVTNAAPTHSLTTPTQAESFCMAQNIAASFLPASAATGGDIFGGVKLINKGSVSCQIKGEPDISVTDNQGTALHLTFTKKQVCPPWKANCAVKENIELQPYSESNQTFAEEPFEWHLYANQAGQECPSITPSPNLPLKLQIILPNNGGTLSLPLANGHDENLFIKGNCNPYIIFALLTN